MYNKKISIIIPLYNCEDYLENCIKSIVKQTYPIHEIIIVDDGSKDSSYQIAKELSFQYTNIILFTQNNSGVSVARNKGIDESSGDFIMFVDPDDELKPEMVEKLVYELEDDIDVVCCSYSVLNSGNEELMFENDFTASSIEQKKPLFFQLMDYKYGRKGACSTAIGVPWGKLIRKKVIETTNLRFDQSLRRMQDNIFCTWLFALCNKIKYIAQSLYLYRVDHISSKEMRIYDFDIYLNLLSKRQDFFLKNKEIYDDEIAEYFYLEKLNYLLMSINKISLDNIDTSQKKSMILNLISNELYCDTLKHKFVNLTNKRRIQCFLIKHRLINLLIFIYVLMGKKRGLI